MKIFRVLLFYFLVVFMASGLFSCGQENQQGENREALRIKPWSEDPGYWQYKGEPVMLLGGTDQDNLFNHPDLGPDGLEAHLDLLASVGGNYVRNTMSSRDRIDATSNFFNNDNIYPFHRDQESGLYDLDRFNDEYWDRFRNFLDMTAERDIIVQIEMWDRWDYSGDRHPHYNAYGWSAQPFNPKNNINYSSGETNLDDEKWQGHPIFRTIPELDNVPQVLAYQEALVDKLLSITFEYYHILYCVSNESNASEEWSRHWANFIRDRAGRSGVGVEVTEMWDNWDLTHQMHQRTFAHPDLYSFVDISQNNHQQGQTHWDNMQAAHRLLTDRRPMNNVKIYGGTQHGGGLDEGTNKFWRIILGGCSSARFHRGGRVTGYYGAGLSELAQTQIRSARLFLEEFDLFSASPDEESSLLSNREENEAYLAFIPGEQYAVYFPDGGSVNLDMSGTDGNFTMKWLDISSSTWSDQVSLQPEAAIEITAPGDGQWLALIVR
jgi:hypothetical protein